MPVSQSAVHLKSYLWKGSIYIRYQLNSHCQVADYSHSVTLIIYVYSCWMEESRSSWILSGPVCVSMLTNAFFLVNIVRVLVTKLRAPPTTTSSYRAPLPPTPPVNPAHSGSAENDEDCHHLAPIHHDGENGGRSPVRAGSPNIGRGGSQHHRNGTSLSGLRKAVR